MALGKRKLQIINVKDTNRCRLSTGEGQQSVLWWSQLLTYMLSVLFMCFVCEKINLFPSLNVVLVIVKSISLLITDLLSNHLLYYLRRTKCFNHSNYSLLMCFLVSRIVVFLFDGPLIVSGTD